MKSACALSAKSLAIFLFLLLTMAIGAPARADAFDDARAVYDRGDFGQARDMFRPLAEAGDRSAQTMMGHFTVGGRGFPPNIAESAKWYRKAALQCEPIAQAQTFNIIMEESVGDRNSGPKLAQAFEWLRQSAEQDIPPSQLMLSVHLHSGKLHPKSEEESLMWLRRAGEFNFFFAHLELVRRYARGDGVQVDIGEAYFWASIIDLFVERAKGKPSYNVISAMASMGGNTRAELGAKLAPEQRADLDRRAAAWKPKPLPPFKTGLYMPSEIEEGTNFVRGPSSAAP